MSSHHNSHGHDNNDNDDNHLSASIPSLSGSGFLTPSGSPSPLGHILVLYHKATSAFLLRQLATAYSTSLEALELLAQTNLDYGLDQLHTTDINHNPVSEGTRRSFFILKQKLWILHATIYGAMLTDRAENQSSVALSSSTHGRFSRTSTSSSSKENSPEKLVKDLWRRLVDDYGGIEGEVDGQVMVPFVLLCINQKLYALARQITEAYLATLPEGLLIHLETAAGALTTADLVAKDPLMMNYERLVELYLIHVLTKLGEWVCANEFLEYNSVLSDTSKKTYSKILEKLHQKSLRPKKKTPKNTQQHQQNEQTVQQQQQPKGASSMMTTATSSAVSTLVSSPTLSSASSMGSPSMSHSSLVDETSSSADTGVDNLASSTKSPSEKSKGASGKKQKKKGAASSALATTPSSARTATATTSVTTLQGRLWILVQHYTALLRTAGQQMGPNQLMFVVGLVVFLAALSRNRARASRVVKAGMTKVMQTIKMGTTVTSI
ncbi:hypothetical protein BGZ94_003035 [Podila epigama]|nr:hypothetical protein BGZ94_003035 [Podila epigama]